MSLEDKINFANEKIASAFCFRGRFHYSYEHYVEAYRDYSLALELDPKNSDAWFGCGEIRRSLNDYVGAIAYYDKALEFQPDFPMCLDRRGNAKRMLGDYAGAIADFDKLLEYKFCQSSYYDYVWIYRGFARYELGDYAGAIADLEKGISLDGDWANQSEPFRYLGKCYDSLGQREKARINYDRAGR